MPTLSRHVIVDAPADAVWEVVGRQFDRIGEWATAIKASTAIPASTKTTAVTGAPSVAAMGTAPVAGRVCRTGVRLVPQITERLVAYDNTDRTLTYQAEQQPRFLKAARNHWRVDAIDERRSRISLHAMVEPRGLLGWLGYLLLRVQLARVAAEFLQDLQHYVEHGRPSPRKQRQLDTGKR
jgi:Polyketide cyclase / dehydrase and lipid transport